MFEFIMENWVVITLIVGGLYFILTGLEKKFGNKRKDKDIPISNTVVKEDEDVDDVAV